MYMQANLVGIAVYHLARIIEGLSDKDFAGIDIDYEHVNATSVSLSSDLNTSNSLGGPKAVKHAATGSRSAINFDKHDNKIPHILAIRLKKWCRRGTVFVNGLRIQSFVF
jgi:hypothetical protein